MKAKFVWWYVGPFDLSYGNIFATIQDKNEGRVIGLKKISSMGQEIFFPFTAKGMEVLRARQLVQYNTVTNNTL